jgi:hypothetical protein
MAFRVVQGLSQQLVLVNDAGSSSAAPDAGCSSSSSRQAKWGYLLQLQQNSRWAGAAAAFDSKWPDISTAVDGLAQEMPTSSSSTGTHVDVGQLYADALQLCRALAAAAPLPLVCNNPGCDNLEGASEAAVASKMCAGCRCRYCSAACQAADWRRHRKGCKAMAAGGLACS